MLRSDVGQQRQRDPSQHAQRQQRHLSQIFRVQSDLAAVELHDARLRRRYEVGEVTKLDGATEIAHSMSRAKDWHQHICTALCREVDTRWLGRAMKSLLSRCERVHCTLVVLCTTCVDLHDQYKGSCDSCTRLVAV